MPPRAAMLADGVARGNGFAFALVRHLDCATRLGSAMKLVALVSQKLGERIRRHASVRVVDERALNRLDKVLQAGRDPARHVPAFRREPFFESIGADRAFSISIHLFA